MQDETPSQPEPDSRSSAPPPPRQISSRELFADGAREIVIEHGTRLYRMRITQSGKLILTA